MYKHTGFSNYLRLAHARMEKLFSLDAFSNHVRARLRNSTDAESALYKQKLIIREEIDLLSRQQLEESDHKTRLDSLNKAFVAVTEQLGTSYNSKDTEANISLDGLREKLDSNEVALYYVHDKMGSTLYGLCITQDTIVAIQQQVNDLEALIYKTNVSLSNSQSSNYKEFLQHLYKIFIGQISDIIKDKELTISSMGKLELVPYDLLMDSANSYLCFSHPVRHIYSAGSREKTNAQKSSGIYGYTSSPNGPTVSLETRKEEYVNLNAAREEIEYLKEEYGAKVFVDEASTKKRFKNTAEKASIIHLALHGITNPLEPLKSRLVFSLDGEKEEDLYYHEIDDLNINAQLVTLSACNSGRGNMRGAGSIASLARAFHYAGSPNVVQTLWSVNDETSAQLMKSFYNNLHEGQPVPAALAGAKKQFYNSVPKKWKHPYYWGGYIYNGQNTSIQINRKSGWMPYAIGCAIILLLLFFIIRYKSSVV